MTFTEYAFFGPIPSAMNDFFIRSIRILTIVYGRELYYIREEEAEDGPDRTREPGLTVGIISTAMTITRQSYCRRSRADRAQVRWPNGGEPTTGAPLASDTKG